jgi:ferritin-like metal-binding protein YciE
MSTDSLSALLEEEIKDLYDAEKQLTNALPKLVKKASNPELQAALTEHLRQTQEHVERLEQVLEQLGLPARGKKCEGMQHLISEGNEMISEAEEDATRDAVMIAAAQKVEHYEIAGYGTCRTWANLLGKTDIAALLEDTLEEEKQADEKLTAIAENVVNEASADEGRSGEDEEEGGEDEEPSSSRRGGRQVRSARAGYMRSGRERAADAKGKKRGRR